MLAHPASDVGDLDLGGLQGTDSVRCLMGAGLFVRSLSRLSAVNLGFSDDHLLVADLPVPPAGTAPAEVHRNMDFYENTLRELRMLPGVKFAAATSFLPVSGRVGHSLFRSRKHCARQLTPRGRSHPAASVMEFVSLKPSHVNKKAV